MFLTLNVCMTMLLHTTSNSTEVLQSIARENILQQAQCTIFKERATQIIEATQPQQPGSDERWRNLMTVLWTYPGMGAEEVVVYRSLRSGSSTPDERRILANSLGASCPIDTYSNLAKAALALAEKSPTPSRSAELRELVLDKAMRDMQQPMHLLGIVRHAQLFMELDNAGIFGRRYQNASKKMRKTALDLQNIDNYDPQVDLQQSEGFREDFKKWIAGEIAR